MTAMPVSHQPMATSSQTSKCPVTGRTHEWREPESHASRSPCPALNTMSNHGYLPRDGRNISVWVLIAALQECYNLSAPLAWFLSIVGFLALHNYTLRPMDLYDIGRHGIGLIHSRVEHNASLAHLDTHPGDLYAPIGVVREMVDELIADAVTERDLNSKSKRVLMSAEDVGRSRVRVEKNSPKLDSVHAEIARGEMAIMLGMWGVTEDDNDGAPAEWVKEWILHERLPAEWKKERKQGLLDTIKMSKRIKNAMEEMRTEESQSRTILSDVLIKATSTGIRALGLGLSHRRTGTSGSLTPSTSTSSSTYSADVSMESNASSNHSTAATSDVEDNDEPKEF